MFVAAAFYGLLAFEGLFLAIRPVNALSRCTDWTVGHVQSGTLGWLAMIVFGSLYTLVPHLAGQDRMRWPRAVERHFRLGVPATLVHVVAMWNAGIPQGLMWRTHDAGSARSHGFLQSVMAMAPYDLLRTFGGALFLLGALICVANTLDLPPAPRAGGSAGPAHPRDHGGGGARC